MTHSRLTNELQLTSFIITIFETPNIDSTQPAFAITYILLSVFSFSYGFFYFSNENGDYHMSYNFG
jgi:hypothetical protein